MTSENTISRRKILQGLAAMGTTLTTSGFALAATAKDGGTAAIEKQAAIFGNPLRLPGSSGLYGVLAATDFKEVRVIRTEIEILPGKKTPYLAYAVESGGKTYLNPALLARRGDEIRVKMVNQLNEPTIIHWHGLQNDSRNDGNGLYAADPGKSYEYAFKLEERASMHWYHPHTHGYIPQQAYHGLASLLFIEDDEEAALRKSLDLTLGVTEIPLVIQDRTFDAQGKLQYQPTDAEKMMGFLGERILINLTDQPFITAERRIYRFRILNGSNARSYQLAFLQQGRKLAYHLIGTDGGLLSAAQRMEQTFIAPGQRLDVLLDLREVQDGKPVTLATLAFDPMHAEGAMNGTPGNSMAGMDHSKMDMPPSNSMAVEGDARALLRIDVKGSPAYANVIPSTLSTLAAPAQGGVVTRRIKLAQGKHGTWTIDGQTFDMKKIPITVKRGSKEIWQIENARASMPHPMHIHGFPFRVLERRGSPAQVRALSKGTQGLLPQDLGFSDTVQVWPGESVRIAIDFSHTHAGDQDYVFHCHNLEHEEAGMMVRYRVVS
jgi:blue copper oxidase